MIKPTPSIVVDVDLTNPGQFFACCGLLELADRLWPGAQGWFESNKFYISGSGNLTEALSALVANEPIPLEKYECNNVEIPPMNAPLSLSLGTENTINSEKKSIIVDGWLKIINIKRIPTAVGNTPWNFWSGNQKSYGIWMSLRRELIEVIARLNEYTDESIFSIRTFQKGRFGFDPLPAWNKIDVGFSPNDQGMDVESSSAIELLSAVGILRFKPIFTARDVFEYCSWSIPLPISIAAVASVGKLDTYAAKWFRCKVVDRGSYGALSYASQLFKE